MAKTKNIWYNGTSEDYEIISHSFDYTHFAELTDQNGEFRMVCTDAETACSTENPVIIRYAISNVNDVYKGTDIDPSAYAPTRSGKSLVLQITQNVVVTDTEDPSYNVTLPLSAHIVYRLPNSELLDTSTMNKFVQNLCGTMFTSGGVNKLSTLLRGALKPSDLG